MFLAFLFCTLLDLYDLFVQHDVVTENLSVRVVMAKKPSAEIEPLVNLFEILSQLVPVWKADKSSNAAWSTMRDDIVDLPLAC